jgi:hypothetical protein
MRTTSLSQSDTWHYDTPKKEIRLRVGVALTSLSKGLIKFSKRSSVSDLFSNLVDGSVSP